MRPIDADFMKWIDNQPTVEPLKEQDERGKAICKEICDFIRGSCSTDTDSDKEYVCHIVNQIFIKGWR